MAITKTQVIGTVVLPDGTIPTEGRVIFALKGWDADMDPDGGIVLPAPVTCDLGGDGQVSVQLFTNSEGLRGVVYDVTIEYLDDRLRRPRTPLGAISLVGPGPHALRDLLQIPAVEPTAPGILAQVIAIQSIVDAAAAEARAAAEAASGSASAAAERASAAGTSAEAAEEAVEAATVLVGKAETAVQPEDLLVFETVVYVEGYGLADTATVTVDGRVTAAVVNGQVLDLPGGYASLSLVDEEIARLETPPISVVFIEGHGLADVASVTTDGFAQSAVVNGQVLDLPGGYASKDYVDGALADLGIDASALPILSAVYVEGRGLADSATLTSDDYALEATTYLGFERFGRPVLDSATRPAKPMAPVFDDDSKVYVWPMTGQSNAAGSRGTPLIVQRLFDPSRALMLNCGVNRQGEDAVATRLVPCSERIEEEADPADNIRGETYATSFLDQMTRLVGGIHVAVISGQGSATYDSIKKGTTVYDRLMSGIQQVFDLAAAGRLPDGKARQAVVAGTLIFHGESDSGAGTTDYFAKGVEWQDDIDTDAKVITGQADDIPFYWLQVSSFGTAGDATPVIDMMRLHDESPHHVVCAPGWPYDYGDGVHHSALGRRQASEALARAVVEHKASGSFEPVRLDRRGTISGAVVRVPILGAQFAELDPFYRDRDGLDSPYGFAFEDSDGFAEVSKVVIEDGQTLVATLAATPTGHSARFWMARKNVDGTYGGSRTKTALQSVGDGTPSLYGMGQVRKFGITCYAALAGGRQAIWDAAAQLGAVTALDASSLVAGDVATWHAIYGVDWTTTGGGLYAAAPPAAVAAAVNGHAAVQFREEVLASEVIDLSEDVSIFLGVQPLSTRTGIVLDARNAIGDGFILLANAVSGNLEAVVTGESAVTVCALDAWAAVSVQFCTHTGARFVRVQAHGGAATDTDVTALPLPTTTGRRAVLGAQLADAGGSYAQADFDLTHFIWADKEVTAFDTEDTLAAIAAALGL